LTEDEEVLFSLQNELDEQEFAEYSEEVYEILELLEGEMEELQSGDPNNY
jgi:hypothetical protein